MFPYFEIIYFTPIFARSIVNMKVYIKKKKKKLLLNFIKKKTVKKKKRIGFVKITRLKITNWHCKKKYYHIST